MQGQPYRSDVVDLISDIKRHAPVRPSNWWVSSHILNDLSLIFRYRPDIQAMTPSRPSAGEEGNAHLFGGEGGT